MHLKSSSPAQSAVAFFLSTLALNSHAAVIVPTGSVTVSSGDVFKSNIVGNSYSLASGTTLNSYSYLPDLFGSALSSIEPGNVTFSDNKAAGFASSVNVTLSASVRLSDFDLYVSNDTSTGARSLREFRLYSGSTLLSDVTVLDTTGTQTYTSVYGGSMLRISDSLASAPASPSYTLTFIQNKPASSSSGVRAVEFAAYVPEPASLWLLTLASPLCLRRSKRS